MVPSSRLALESKITDPHDRSYDVDALEERIHNAERNGCPIKSRFVGPIMKRLDLKPYALELQKTT